MDEVTLFEEYRLIEKAESDINGAWKGAHILLFFLSFVFGSFCTFCFHLLIYLFDEKCVLYPKLLSLKDRANPNTLILEYIVNHKDIDSLPVDFVTTQWMDKSTCYLPTYVPLLSGICGLIWTTMFLMCSSGRTLTGLQRPWRILPVVFIFSLLMGGLSIYTSVITHYGLQELCTKLGELTGSATCTYTINVATLAYERRIRGVYQATRLTMTAAWLHTLCWVGAALVALARIVLVVDFNLVRVRADLRGNIEKMLERHEKHIRTDEFGNKDDSTTTGDRNLNSKEVAEEHQFIVEMLYDIADHIGWKIGEFSTPSIESPTDSLSNLTLLYRVPKRINLFRSSTSIEAPADLETREMFRRELNKKLEEVKPLNYRLSTTHTDSDVHLPESNKNLPKGKHRHFSTQPIKRKLKFKTSLKSPLRQTLQTVIHNKHLKDQEDKEPREEKMGSVQKGDEKSKEDELTKPGTSRQLTKENAQDEGEKSQPSSPQTDTVLEQEEEKGKVQKGDIISKQEELTKPATNRQLNKENPQDEEEKVQPLTAKTDTVQEQEEEKGKVQKEDGKLKQEELTKPGTSRQIIKENAQDEGEKSQPSTAKSDTVQEKEEEKGKVQKEDGQSKQEELTKPGTSRQITKENPQDEEEKAQPSTAKIDTVQEDQPTEQTQATDTKQKKEKEKND